MPRRRRRVRRDARRGRLRRWRDALAPELVLGGPEPLYGAYGRDAVGVLDLDGNGLVDIAVPDALGARVMVYLVRPGGLDAPIALPTARHPASIPSASVAPAGDVNEDGYALSLTVS